MLATSDAEIKRIIVRGQAEQIVCETPPDIQNNQSKMLKQYRVCFASVKPRVQTPVLPPKKVQVEPVLIQAKYTP
jgi:hypothetical protein